MSRSFIKLAIRNIRKNLIHSIINLVGLTVGFSACMIAAMIIWNALSYDRQWTNSRELYRILTIDQSGKTADRNVNTLTGLGPALKQNFPSIIEFCRLRNVRMNLAIDSSDGGIWSNCLASDPGILKMLDINILEGNPGQLIDAYPNLIISQRLKDILFHNSDPIGKKIIRTSDYNVPYEGKKKQYIITGVMKDLPENSHFFADALLLDGPWPGENDLGNSFGTVMQQYILIRPRTDVSSLTTNINDWYIHLRGKDASSTLFFQPITSINLHPEIGNDPDTAGSMHNIYIYLGIAALLIIIVSFNYTNLSLAISLQRIPAFGIRSVLGATRSQIILQSLTESFIFFLIAFAAAFLIFLLSLGPTGRFIGHALTLSGVQYTLLFLLCAGILLTIVIGSGFYPAWILSRINPAKTIRGNFIKLLNTNHIRKVLIVGQFAIAIILFIFISTVRKQLSFIDHKDLGFDKDNLLCIDNNVWGTKGTAFKQEVLRLPGITAACISSWNPALGQGYMSTAVNDQKDSAKKIKIWYISGDQDLLPTLRFHLLKGDSLRDKAPDTLHHAANFSGNNTDPILITDYTANLFDIRNLNVPVSLLQGKPSGIVANFNNGSLHFPITPCVITDVFDPPRGYMLIRTTGPANKQLPDQLRHLWRQFYPAKILEFSWISDSLAQQYSSEQKLQASFTSLGWLSILLACLGLFGLVSFSVNNRSKEIGIRKALGASASAIIFMISDAYFKLILIAIVIASPIALWIGSAWLSDFAYHIDLTWGMFVIVWLLIFLLVLSTLYITVARTALQKPAVGLRME